MTEFSDVLIVGGGVIGLSIAYALAGAGVGTTVLDRRDMGREASWAGAGLIPPITERPLPAAHPAYLRSWSSSLYPAWSEQIFSETGVDVGYRRTGGLDVAWNDAEDQELRTAMGRMRTEGVAYERITPGDFGRVEPALNRELLSAVFLPDRAQVRNPWLLRGLITGVANRGGRLLPWHSVERIEVSQNRVTGVQTSAGRLACGTLIMAAGSWSGQLLRSIDIAAPTPPLKGQLVLLKLRQPTLRRIIEHGKDYLVPREDGRVLMGATEEDVGFDTLTTYQATEDLVRKAIRLCPILKTATIEATWAGLRPGSIDRRPYIGRSESVANLIVATGHRRAGLQLAPATAEVVADLVLERPLRADLSGYRPGREASAGIDDTFRS
jgi:glycine oxidase